MNTKHSKRAEPTPDAEFFDMGWCWMRHPDWNEGRAIPVYMQMNGPVRMYYPLDPADATDFEWDRRDDEWEMIVPPLAASLVDAAPALLMVARLVVNTIHSVENRCMAADGPVTPTCDEITDAELRAMYEAARDAIRATEEA